MEAAEEITVEWRRGINGDDGYVNGVCVMRVGLEYLYRRYRYYPRCWEIPEVGAGLRGVERHSMEAARERAEQELRKFPEQLRALLEARG